MSNGRLSQNEHGPDRPLADVEKLRRWLPKGSVLVLELPNALLQ